MTILCFALTVVVPIRKLDEKYPGGFPAYYDEAKYPGVHVCADDDLVGVYFRSPQEVAAWVESLQKHGLIFFKGDEIDQHTVAVDLTVVDMLTGPTLVTPWLLDSFDSGRRIVWAKGAERTDAVIPETFDLREIEDAVFVSNKDSAKGQPPMGPGMQFVLPGHPDYPGKSNPRKWPLRLALGVGLAAGVTILLFFL